jgi:hypothetical protein
MAVFSQIVFLVFLIIISIIIFATKKDNVPYPPSKTLIYFNVLLVIKLVYLVLTNRISLAFIVNQISSFSIQLAIKISSAPQKPFKITKIKPVIPAIYFVSAALGQIKINVFLAKIHTTFTLSIPPVFYSVPLKLIFLLIILKLVQIVLIFAKNVPEISLRTVILA